MTAYKIIALEAVLPRTENGKKFKLNVTSTEVFSGEWMGFTQRLDLVETETQKCIAYATIKGRFETLDPSGTLLYSQPKPEIEIEKITLKEIENSGKGFGTAMMSEIKCCLRELKKNPLWASARVYTDVSTAEAAFYTKHGFTVDPQPVSKLAVGTCSAVRLNYFGT